MTKNKLLAFYFMSFMICSENLVIFIRGHHHHSHFGGEIEPVDNEVMGEFAEKLSKFSLNVFKNTLKSPVHTPASFDAAVAVGGPAHSPRTSANLFMAPLTAVSPLMMRSLAFESMFESVEEVMELMHLNRAFNNRFGVGGAGGGHGAARHPQNLANVFHQILGLFNPLQWNQAGNFYPPPPRAPVLPPVYSPPFPEIPSPHMNPHYHDPPPYRHNIYRGAGGRLSPFTEQLSSSASGMSAALIAAPPSSLPTVSPFAHDPNDGLQVAYFSKFLIPNQLHVNQTFAQHLHTTFGAEVFQLDPHASAPQVVDQLERMLYVNHSAVPDPIVPVTLAADVLIDANATLSTTAIDFVPLADPNVVRNVGKTFERLVQPSWFEASPTTSQNFVALPQIPSVPAVAVAAVAPPPVLQQQVVAAPAAAPQQEQQQNAMFVNGVDVNTQWEYVFDPRKTRREKFHASLYEAPEVDMMHQEGIFSVGQEENIRALKLPLRGGEHSMLIMMPKKPKHTAQANIKQIVSELSWDLLRELKSEMKPRPVRLGLPRFRTTSAMNMMQPLRMAGLRKPPTLGDYAGAFVDPLADAASTPSQILHFANIDINEAYDPRSSALTAYDASQAARVAAFQAAAGHGHILNFIADKPFVYIIMHEPTGTVLFAGKVENPSISEPSFSAPPPQPIPLPPPPPPPPPPPAVQQMAVLQRLELNTPPPQPSPAEVLISGVETLPPGSGLGTQTLVTAVNPPSYFAEAAAAVGATPPPPLLTGLDGPQPDLSTQQRLTLFDAPASSSAAGGIINSPMENPSSGTMTVVEMIRPNVDLIGTAADAPVKTVSGTRMITPLAIL